MAFYDALLPRRMKKDLTIIPVVRLQGTIMTGGSQFRPALNLASVAGSLDKAFSMKRSPAVAIIVNSPGGSPVQSRLIFKRIRDLAEEKQKRVHIFVEDVAASGGYMIALAGDEIIADPSSIVGSIGVVSASFGFPELLKKIGVERRVYTAGQSKVSLDPFQPEKETDVEHLKSLQRDVHATFIDLVKARRQGKLAADDDTLFNGLFWSGVKGRELGLVDELGDMHGFLKARYGEKMRTRLIAPRRGLFGGRIPASIGSDDFAQTIAASATQGVADALENKAIWGRYGL
ncbi:S49 family peptidase [Georhizobium profundi]|jgi:signal peptide peptidase SppA|uniref:S49 family peptidase n=1 Tax=Georhizobium profundi TaxID=2341112 RepID=A0A3S9B7G9_9HYPH|nr:S49 family peptidase [Georhizobium profundi]AZN72834.1 S49 family peptidase [Georhizobium profundi]